jgi:hypothetical protein
MLGIGIGGNDPAPVTPAPAPASSALLTPATLLTPGALMTPTPPDVINKDALKAAIIAALEVRVR